MPQPSWSGKVSRKIVRRIVVEGDLVLQTPAHLGNGDGNDLVDMPLLTDSLETKKPLLTGASIAGALRSYLREREHGFRAKAGAPSSASVLLFGGNKGSDYGEQSLLIVDDARGKGIATSELRDGIRLSGVSRTAEEKKLFTFEMWEAGTIFPLRFELIIRQADNVAELKRALATALAGFTDGSITIGSRKRRGYGQVNVTGWRSKEYDLTKAVGLLDWIENGAGTLSGPVFSESMHALGVSELIADQRQSFRLHATFSLDGSLLIRSGSLPAVEQVIREKVGSQRPDAIHLHSTQPASSPDGQRERVPVLSGTSLAGALRARAFKIARLVAPPTEAGKEAAQNVIDSLFGADMDTGAKPEASRLSVYERVISDVEHTLVQNRVSLDRFTGGTRDGALFSEQPLFGQAQSLVTVDLQLANPHAYEIGLLLCLLKDLWTGDLPLGGEISIGRGRLCGKSCHLEYRNGQVTTWDLFASEATGLSVTTGERQDLEEYVAKLHTHLAGSNT